MAKPVRCRRSPATVSAPGGVGARSTSLIAVSPPSCERERHHAWLSVASFCCSPSPSSCSWRPPARRPRTSRPRIHPTPRRPLSSHAPSASPSADAEPYPVTVTDDAGRELLVEAEPQRIVSLAPSNTEIVCALDACDRLVGVTDFDDYPPEVADVDDVVIAATVDVELVVAAEPDLVLAAGNELTPTPVIEQLEELGLPVLVLYPETLDEVYADIELVGEVLDRGEEAAALVEDMEDRVAEVVAAVEGADTPRTLYEVFYGEGTTYTAGEGSFLGLAARARRRRPGDGRRNGRHRRGGPGRGRPGADPRRERLLRSIARRSRHRPRDGGRATRLGGADRGS